MNEQIEKLAELSGFKQDMLNIGIWYCPEFQKFAERFAELIVQECADVCRRFGESGDGYTCSAEIFRTFRR
jgi:hypothetical protein